MASVATVNIDGTNREILQLKFGSGSNKRANPQRPTGAWGKGTLSIANYRTDQRKRIKINIGGTTYVDAWIGNQRYDDITNISTYQIEGRPFQSTRNNIMVTQTSTNANATQAAILNVIRDAFDQSSIDVSITSTPLSLYSFTGPLGGYVSRFALVTGSLPYATSVGQVGLKDPTSCT